MVRFMWLLRPLDRSAAVEDWATEMAPAANALAAGRWHQICRLLARSTAPTTFAVLPLECTSFEASLNSTAAARRSGRQCGAQLFPVYSWDQSAGVCQLNSLSTRLASTPRRNDGDDQVSLRHPLTVGRSTYPDSCDTLLVCPETRHCTCHPASPPARASGSKPDASCLCARLTCTPAGLASRGFTRRRAFGAPRRPRSRPRPRPRRP